MAAKSRWAWIPTTRDIADGFGALFATALGLAIGISLLPAVQVSSFWWIIIAAATVGLWDLLLRPALRLLAQWAGAFFAVLLGLISQVAVLLLALNLLPGFSGATLSEVLLLVVITSLAMALARWVSGSSDSEYVIADLLRRSRAQQRRAGKTPGPVREPGLLIIQLDGLSPRVLDEAIRAGLAPTMQGWLRTGTHQVEQWWASIPATTPASQAGILHGNTTEIPAFRWWDRKLNRLVVTNNPVDAALVETRLSDGSGLLSGGGAAIGTMVSGDAETNLLVVSQVTGQSGLGPGSLYVRFFARPFVFSRALLMTLAEMVKESYQSRRQVRHGVWPRVPRGITFNLARAASNILLRDLSLSLLAGQMVRGTPIIYGSLVDYDEIAHYAGPTRPEAMRALEGLDRLLWSLTQVAAISARDYRIVVLSDHGQSIGPTYLQQEGESLEETVSFLTDIDTLEGVAGGGGEDWGQLNALLSAAIGTKTGSRPVSLSRRDRITAERVAQLGVPKFAVIGSGNLGMIWFPPLPEPPTWDELSDQWPALIPGLLSKKSVGFVVVRTAERGPVAIGPAGLHFLNPPVAGTGVPTNTVEGDDPLARYPKQTADDLRHLMTLENTGDVVLISALSAEGMVHAFEGLVGSHGGVGGPQNDALLMYPRDLELDGAEPLVGADQVHEQLQKWKHQLGL